MINASQLATTSFGERVKYFRKRCGYSQEILAEMLGVSVSTISNYENNRSYPNAEKLSLLADLLNISMNLLLRAYDPVDRSKSILED